MVDLRPEAAKPEAPATECAARKALEDARGWFADEDCRESFQMREMCDAALDTPCNCEGLREENEALRRNSELVTAIRALMDGETAESVIHSTQDAAVVVAVQQQLATANEHIANLEENFKVQASGHIAAIERADRAERETKRLNKTWLDTLGRSQRRSIEWDEQEAKLRKELADAVEALRSIQWSGDYSMCPLCDRCAGNGHSPDCTIGMVIARFDAQGGSDAHA